MEIDGSNLANERVHYMSGQSTKGTALVTGASSGIGAAYAERLARRGYDLILVARDQARLDGLASRIGSETGVTIESLRADLTVQADVLRVERRIRQQQDITMLVNNAGVGALEPLLQSDIGAMEAMIDLNVTALTRLTYAVAPTFVARGGGTIINISSVVAVAPEVLNGVYGASKAFVLAFSQSLHKELADKNVRVQVVLPGATATNFWDAAGGAIDNLPSAMVMRSDDLVDAALAGFDQGELVTIPSLPDVADWFAYEGARQKLIPNLSLNSVPSRYRTALAA
jgi:short-subunit dehydrogenase